MNRIILLFTALMLCIAGGARRHKVAYDDGRRPYPGGPTYLYRITLADKSGTPYSLQEPEKFLSQRSIDRRQRQGLPLDSTDLPVSPIYINKVKALGLDVVGQSKWNNTLLLRSPNEYDIFRVYTLPFVRSIRQVFSSPDSTTVSARAEVRQKFSPTDSSATQPYGKGWKQISMLNGQHLHGAGFRGQGMLIAIIDGGFMNADSIPAMRNISIVGSHNFVVPGTQSVFQELDHGTMVLSTMGTNQPGYMIGTAPEASYLLLRSEDGRTESLAEEDFWAEAAEYADSAGADVVNSSLGYHAFDNKADNYKYSELDGNTALISKTASLMAHKGMILVNSAGNEAFFSSWKKINVPADAFDILSIGACDSDSVNAMFSSLGYTADLRVKPDVTAMGVNSSVISGHGNLLTANGTSFSSPITAGLVACLWQAFPQLNAVGIINLVRHSADRYRTPDNVYGYGIPDFWKAYQIGKSLTNPFPKGEPSRP